MLHDLRNIEITFEDPTLLLYVKIEAEYEGLKPNDLLTVIHNNRLIKYLIHTIEYTENNCGKFIATLIFLEFLN